VVHFIGSQGPNDASPSGLPRLNRYEFLFMAAALGIEI
jgi:hypothetical protein